MAEQQSQQQPSKPISPNVLLRYNEDRAHGIAIPKKIGTDPQQLVGGFVHRTINLKPGVNEVLRVEWDKVKTNPGVLRMLKPRDDGRRALLEVVAEDAARVGNTKSLIAETWDREKLKEMLVSATKKGGNSDLIPDIQAQLERIRPDLDLNGEPTEKSREKQIVGNASGRR